MRVTLATLLFLAPLFADVLGFFDFPFEGTREPVQIIPVTRNVVVQTLWIEQLLDHFNPRDSRTWKMRYMANDQYFKPGGPIVIYIGGEWEISSSAILGGQTAELAKRGNGYMFYVEHRYYGKSHPTPDATTENLKYLSTDQALADLAHFVQYIKASNKGLSNSKVLVIGGSYAGNVAAWFRMKYAHLVDAAWASSGPVLAIADMYQYLEVVGQALITKGGQKCYDVVEKAIGQLKAELQKPNGPAYITKKFRLCRAIDITSQLEHEYFYVHITSAFSGMVQSHVGNNIELGCAKLLDRASGATELDRLVAFLMTRGWAQGPCVNTAFDSYVDHYKETSWTHGSTMSNVRQWNYHSCTGLGYYGTANSAKQPFGQGTFGMGTNLQKCHELFWKGIGENAREILDRGINSTNTKFGGLTPDVTHVIFSHGSLDPWSAIGIQKDINELSPAIVIPGASHSKDLQTSLASDSEEMKAARKRILGLLAQWLDFGSSSQTISPGWPSF